MVQQNAIAMHGQAAIILLIVVAQSSEGKRTHPMMLRSIFLCIIPIWEIIEEAIGSVARENKAPGVTTESNSFKQT